MPHIVRHLGHARGASIAPHRASVPRATARSADRAQPGRGVMMLRPPPPAAGRFLQNQTYSPRMNQQACALVFTQRS